MLTDIQKEWVELLRSGKFKQGTGVLHNAENNYRCCLGVAIEVCKRHGITFKEEITSFFSNGVSGEAIKYDGLGGCLPEKAVNFIGLSTNFGTFLNGDLSELNDDGKTFEEIADLIESEPEGLFKK